MIPNNTKIIIKNKGKRGTIVRDLPEKKGYLVRLPNGGHVHVPYNLIEIPS